MRLHPSKKMSGLSGVNGTVCNMQQYQQSLLTDTYPTISCLTRGQNIGLAVSILICRDTYSKVKLMSHAVVDRGIIHQSRCRNRCPSVDRGMSNLCQCLSTLTKPCREMCYVTERPFQTAIGNYCGGLLTFTWSAQSFHCLTRSHFILVTVFPFCVRYCAGRRWHPRCSMGPQWDRQCGPLLYSTRRHSANRRTRGRTDYSRVSLLLRWLTSQDTDVQLSRYSPSIHSLWLCGK